MKSEVAGWIFFRALRWLSYLGLIAFSIYFNSDRTSHFNAFGQLTLGAETMLFGLPLLGWFAGMFELMMRERGGIARPKPFQLWPGLVSD